MKQNRKIMARVLSLAMTAMMVFGLSATAFAAGPDGPDDANISGGATENSNYGGYPSNINGLPIISRVNTPSLTVPSSLTST